MYKDVQIIANYRRLKNIRRCNNFPTITTEDVAEHTFYVSVIALTLAEEYNRYVNEHNKQYHPLDVENLMEEVNVETVMKRALFHDMEECFTSDIPYNVKHYNKDLNNEFRYCVQDMLDRIYRGINSPDIYSHLYYIEQCKQDKEGEFVALADLIEGAWYCFEEMEMGNQSIRGLFFNYMDEINNLECTKLLKLTCPTLEATLRLFSGKLSSVPFPRPETELIV